MVDTNIAEIVNNDLINAYKNTIKNLQAINLSTLSKLESATNFALALLADNLTLMNELKSLEEYKKLLNQIESDIFEGGELTFE